MSVGVQEEPSPALETTPERASWVLSGATCSPRATALIGGKAAGLARLRELGQTVPPWLVVTTEAFDHVLGSSEDGDPRHRLAELERAGAGDLEAVARRESRRLTGLEIPEDLRRAIAHRCAETLPGGTRLAVRSSAVDEDQAAGSFAGVHETVLGIRDLEELPAAILRVWASAFGPEAVAYRRARSLSSRSVSMAVVIQHMVVPRVSGALFTADPVTGDVHRIVINALWGAGEGLMSHDLPADVFRVDKNTLEMVTERSIKTEEMVPDGEGLVRKPVPPERASEPCLTQEQVRTLARTSLDVERAFGRPQDLEFTLDGEGRIFWLQSRPVTTVEEDGPAAGNRIVWDHENWAENFPGITLPMTFSVTRRMERVQYRCFAEMMRVDPEKVEEYQSTYDTALGYVRGRVVTNLVNRYRLLRLIPGIDFKRKLFYGLLRVRPEEIVESEERPEPSAIRRWLVELPRLLRLFGGLTGDFFRVRRMVDELLEEGRRFHTRVEALDLDRLKAHELVAVYREAEIRLAVKWTPVLLNALFLRGLYLLLKKLCASWCGDEDGSLLHDLMRGEAGAESVRPLREMLELASEVRREPTLARLFAKHSPEELAELIPDDPRNRGFADKVHRYLERYHFKGAGEMKLEDPTLLDRPEWFYQRLAEYVELEDPEAADPGGPQARQARREAERQTFGALGPLRRWVFRRLLHRVRALDLHREEVKFLRLQLMGLFRQVLRQLGARFAETDVLDAPRDIFYLTLEEALDYVQGASATTNLRGLVDLRRREMEEFRQTEAPDDRFETYGLAYARNRYRSRRSSEAATPSEGMLQGTGCSRGRVTAEARAPASPQEAQGLSGCILVVERLHGGWTPVLPTVAGVLVERGEILSHAATVARELNIPAIVGIPGLMKTVTAGRRITIDGAAGTIVLADRESEDAR